MSNFCRAYLRDAWADANRTPLFEKRVSLMSQVIRQSEYGFISVP